METNKTFNSLAKNYFENRSSKNFDTIYLELRKIGKIARKGLTVDDDDFETITTDLALRLKENFDSLYQENKSLFSYCLKAFHSKYYSLLKKYNKTVRESSLFRQDEDSNSIFENLVARDSVFNETKEEDTEDILHNSPKLQTKLFFEIVEDVYKDEIDLMRDIFTFRRDDEVGNASIWVSPEELANKHGIAKRTTISAKRTRALQKIAPILAERIELSKAVDGESSEGVVSLNNQKITYKDKEIVEASTVDKYGNITTKTRVEDGWMVETKNPKGVVILSGKKTLCGKRVGVWSEFHDNGRVSARCNYDHKLQFMTFDNFGNGIQMGKLTK